MNGRFFRVTHRNDVLGDGTPCIIAEHPELPGCYGFGSNHEEALERLRNAREAYLMVLEQGDITCLDAAVGVVEAINSEGYWLGEDEPAGERLVRTA